MTNIEKKAIYIGVITIITIVASILGYEYLKGNNPFKSDRYFYAKFKNVYGLNPTAPVTVNGVTVGQISDISFNPTDGSVIVKFLIEEKNIKIPKSSTVEIYSTDALGTKALRINLGSGNQYFSPGDTLPSSVEVQLMNVLISKLGDFEEIFSQTKQIIQKINNLLSDQSIRQIQQSIEYLQSAIYIIDTTLGRNSYLQLTIADLYETVNSLKNQTHDLQAIVQNTRQITDTLRQLKLNQSLNQLNQTIDQLLTLIENINKGKGTIGQLTVNDTLYLRIDSLVKNLNDLAKYLKQHPSKAFQMTLLKIGKGD